ncbi:MAG: hypothetical protein AAFW74_01165, partial [Pseudomonadota bacterium]
IEAVIKSEDHRHLSDEALELSQLLQIKPELSDRAFELMAEDPRIDKSVRLRTTLSLALYSIDDGQAIRALLRDASTDNAVFGELAEELGQDEIRILRKISDRRRLLEVTMKYLRDMSSDQNSASKFSLGLDLVERLELDMEVPEKVRNELVAMMTTVFTQHAKKSSPPILVLKRLARYSLKQAQDLYLQSLGCLTPEQTKNLFNVFDTKELEMRDWNADMTYPAAKIEAQKQMSSRSLTCGW